MDDLTLSLKSFVAKLTKTKDPDLVFSRVLRLVHGSEKHSEVEWRVLVDALRKSPVAR